MNLNQSKLDAQDTQEIHEICLNDSNKSDRSDKVLISSKSEQPQVNSRIQRIYNIDKLNDSKEKTFFSLFLPPKTRNKPSSKKTLIKNYLFKRLPVLEWTSSYKLKQFLMPDLVSGIILGIINIPQVKLKF